MELGPWAAARHARKMQLKQVSTNYEAACADPVAVDVKVTHTEAVSSECGAGLFKPNKPNRRSNNTRSKVHERTGTETTDVI